MILAPNGLTATARELPMKGRYVKWLNDGESFLVHLADLAAVSLRAECLRCVAHDVADSVRATPDPDHGLVHVACGCRAGKVNIEKPLDVSQLLQALGWRLVCTSCGEPVWGNNDRHADAFTVDCPCTSRVYRVAVA
jgi:hypothetical protein